MGMLFKRSVFGGFRQKEVIEYIEKLKNDSDQQRCQLEEQLNRLSVPKRKPAAGRRRQKPRRLGWSSDWNKRRTKNRSWSGK